METVWRKRVSHLPGAKLAALHRCCCLVWVLCCIIAGIRGQTSPGLQWKLSALYSQRILTEDIPLYRVPMCGSRSSANTFLTMPLVAQQTERNLARSGTVSVGGYQLTGKLHLAEQCYSIRTQLELGVRHLHLELHLRNGAVYVCKSQKSLCDEMARQTRDPAACNKVLGYSDQGQETGCHAGSPTFLTVLQEISDWVANNPTEVLLIRLHVDDLVSSIPGCYDFPSVNTPISTAFTYGLYVPDDYTKFNAASGTSEQTWPSRKFLTSRNHNVVFLSSCSFGDVHVHDYGDAQIFSPFINEFSVASFQPYPSCLAADDKGIVFPPDVDFTFVYDDRLAVDLTIQSDGGSASHLNLSESGMQLTTANAFSIMQCGFNPMMAGFDQTSTEGCVWTYRENHTAFCDPGMCTVLSRRPSLSSRRYDWYNIPCTELRYLLCWDRSGNQIGEAAWRLSPAKFPYPTSQFLDIPTYTDPFGIQEEICDPGYNFKIPNSPLEFGHVMNMIERVNITDEVWLGWMKGVTCRQGEETPAPALPEPKVTSLDCPAVLKEPSIYRDTSVAPTVGTQLPQSTGTKAPSKGLTSTEQVGIILGSLVVFTLLLLLIYFALYQHLTSTHSLSEKSYPQSPGAPVTMAARRQVSSLGGIGRSMTSAAGFQPLRNESTSSEPGGSVIPSPSRNIMGENSLERRISHQSGYASESSSRQASTVQPPSFPIDFSQTPMTRYHSSGSGIPGLTEDEGVVRMNPLFAQVAGGFDQPVDSEDDVGANSEPYDRYTDREYDDNEHEHDEADGDAYSQGYDEGRDDDEVDGGDGGAEDELGASVHDEQAVDDQYTATNGAEQQQQQQQ
eukprot:scpid47527/ scgid28456/ 